MFENAVYLMSLFARSTVIRERATQFCHDRFALLSTAPLFPPNTGTSTLVVHHEAHSGFFRQVHCSLLSIARLSDRNLIDYCRLNVLV